ncbi:MAG: sulfite exporter TauE/SafE family protein [Acidimicrobiales bacterium]
MSAEEAVVALLAIVVGSLLKSISGFGLPLVAIPAISFVADIETAVAAVALPNLALNFVLAWRERDHYGETRDLPVLGATGFVGAIAGTIILVSVPSEPLIALLVVVVTAYAFMFFKAPDFRIGPARSQQLSPYIGTTAGAMQGAIGISGPIVVAWIHSYRLPRGANILSVTALFSLASLAQVPTLAISNQMRGLWAVALIGCVPAVATVPLGARLRESLSSEGFDRFVVITLTVAVLGLAIRTFA